MAGTDRRRKIETRRTNIAAPGNAGPRVSGAFVRQKCLAVAAVVRISFCPPGPCNRLVCSRGKRNDLGSIEAAFTLSHAPATSASKDRDSRREAGRDDRNVFWSDNESWGRFLRLSRNEIADCSFEVSAKIDDNLR